VISELRDFTAFLRFRDFWAIFKVWKGWGCFRSIGSYDNDVLVDMGDYDIPRLVVMKHYFKGCEGSIKWCS